MNRRFFCLTILFLPLIFSACIQTTPGTPDPLTGSFAGHVIEGGSGSPVAGANVNTDPPTSSVTADDNGYFVITDVSPGDYAVTGIKPGYRNTVVKIRVTEHMTTTADIHLVALDAEMSSPAPEIALTTGLIAYYPFDGNANDRSGNENHGQEYGGVEYADGKIGKALDLDGIDDYIKISPQNNVSTIGDFTITVWTFLDGWKNQPTGKDRQYVFDGHTHSNTVSSDFYREGFGVIFDGNGKTEEIHNFIMFDKNNKDFLEQNTSISLSGQWHFIVFSRRGEQDSTYVDGELIPSNYYRATRRNSRLDMNHTWFVGTFSGNNPYYNNAFNYSFMGQIDELRIYDRALSLDEIRTLYQGY